MPRSDTGLYLGVHIARWLRLWAALDRGPIRRLRADAVELSETSWDYVLRAHRHLQGAAYRRPDEAAISRGRLVISFLFLGRLGKRKGTNTCSSKDLSIFISNVTFFNRKPFANHILHNVYSYRYPIICWPASLFVTHHVFHYFILLFLLKCKNDSFIVFAFYFGEGWGGREEGT